MHYISSKLAIWELFRFALFFKQLHHIQHIVLVSFIIASNVLSSHEKWWEIISQASAPEEMEASLSSQVTQLVSCVWHPDEFNDGLEWPT